MFAAPPVYPSSEHYYQKRPHRGLEIEPLVKPKSEQEDKASANVRLKDIRCKNRLGGLLKSRSKKAC
ncbi:MAG: hypothetical protein ACO1RA_12370 [Planctomycetaceae bacterium]